MKKMISLLIALLLPLAALPAMAEEAQSFQLEGVITELTETGFLLEDVEAGTVEVLLSEDTQLLGDLAEEEPAAEEQAEPAADEAADETAAEDETEELTVPEDMVENTALSLAVGQYVIVTYNGQMTRSLPPQVTAQSVSCFIVSGVVSELGEDSLMISDEKLGDVMVRFDETMPQVWEGGLITVYYNGAMTASLPGQIGALRIERPTLTGEMSDLTDDRFLLTDDDGEIWEVLVDDATTLSGTMADGDRVTVVFSGETSEPSEELPAQLTAYAVLALAR